MSTPSWAVGAALLLSACRGGSAASDDARPSASAIATSSAAPTGQVTLIDAGTSPAPLSSPVDAFAPITMLVELRAKEETRVEGRSPTSVASTMSTDFTLRRAAGAAVPEVFDVAMGSLRFEPDTTRSVTGWPLRATRGPRGELASLETPGNATDATALEETFGRFFRLMFVPLPAEPVGIGGRWQHRQKVGDLEETTTFRLIARKPASLSIEVQGTLVADDIAAPYRATLDGTLEAPLAPWRPARGSLHFVAHGTRRTPSGGVLLDLDGRVEITEKGESSGSAK